MALSKILPAAFSTGSIIQVKYAQYTDPDVVALTNDVPTAIHSNLQVTITPSSVNSIIKLEGQIFGEHGDAGVIYNHMVFFFRDTTKLAAPQASNRTSGVGTMTRTYTTPNADSTPEFGYFSYFDSPATTSAITYKLGMIVNSSETFRINKTVADSDSTSNERGISFISATEIVG